jgi:hypothetical protein
MLEEKRFGSADKSINPWHNIARELADDNSSVKFRRAYRRRRQTEREW